MDSDCPIVYDLHSNAHYNLMQLLFACFVPLVCWILKGSDLFLLMVSLQLLGRIIHSINIFKIRNKSSSIYICDFPRGYHIIHSIESQRIK